MTTRRGFLLGIGATLAAPAVVRAESLMKVAALRESIDIGRITASGAQWILVGDYQRKIFRAYLSEVGKIEVAPVALAA